MRKSQAFKQSKNLQFKRLINTFLSRKSIVNKNQDSLIEPNRSKIIFNQINRFRLYIYIILLIIAFRMVLIRVSPNRSNLYGPRILLLLTEK